MYDRILYPTDGSEGATAALDTVRDFAETYSATVHLLFVADTSHEGFGLGHDPKSDVAGMVGEPEGGDGGMVGNRTTADELREEVEAHGQEILDSVAQQLGDMSTTTAVHGGDPHEVILKYAGDEGIDMIVMGTHGRTGLDRYLLGSVTEKVVRFSDVPVLTVRQNDDG